MVRGLQLTDMLQGAVDNVRHMHESCSMCTVCGTSTNPCNPGVPRGALPSTYLRTTLACYKESFTASSP